jgi:DegV family protein with EDD domain
MTISVITDSTADMASDIAEREGITIVPLEVTICGETMSDGTLTQREFFERMNSAKSLPTTSQPSIGTFVQTYEDALQKAESVISVHISSKLSGTFDSARQAAEKFAGKVHVFDSRNLSWGLSWQVIEAARAAAKGLSLPEVLERLEWARVNSKMIVGLDSLDNLARGGRIGRVSAFLGSVLDLKVTFTVDENGSFEPLGRSRGEKAALRYTLEWVDKQVEGVRRARFAVGHALGRERAEALVEQLRARHELAEVVIYEAGSAICTHTGTGWGVALIPER